MTARLMFIQDAAPLARAKVRLSGTSEAFELDEEGRIELELGSGSHSLEIFTGDGWKATRVEIASPPSLMVVEIGPAQSQAHAETLAAYGQPLNSTAPHAPPELMGNRYRLDRVLGRGGMGVVYLATDTRLNRQVALKMLSEALRENPEARRLFLEEARAMATLSHPNLVAVHDVTSFDDRDVIITELVRGKNLDEILEANSPLALDLILNAGFQLATAVAFLHEQGIIHRDLKPANAILEPEGKLKLIDFGLARSIDHLMARGTAVRGTPAYMAPEQILGPQITDKTDVYQLGVTLYELLCKELPFEMTGSGLLAHINKPAIELRTRRTDVPDELHGLIHRCILPEPDQRPTATELASELNAISNIYCDHTLSSPAPSAGPTGATPHVLATSDAATDATPTLHNLRARLLILAALGVAIIVALSVAAFLITRNAATPSEPDPTSEPVAASAAQPDHASPPEERPGDDSTPEALAQARNAATLTAGTITEHAMLASAASASNDRAEELHPSPARGAARPITGAREPSSKTSAPSRATAPEPEHGSAPPVATAPAPPSSDAGAPTSPEPDEAAPVKTLPLPTPEPEPQPVPVAPVDDPPEDEPDNEPPPEAPAPEPAKKRPPRLF
ncbi:serine/threonine protein kinase [Bradymonadaceae bacterium TMQ3]|nr:serine/threonine protein kinase [Bradymonadaceae bacterium TMQ3]TXC75119.1 protein kinase [Bradymonadales bacterium TMQ1]